MRFEPVAIVGSSCTLPGALSPAQLWDNVRSGRKFITGAPEGRWDLPPAWALGAEREPDRAFSDAGGYVQGFDERRLPSGLALPEELIARLDPLFKWVLHGVSEALSPLGHAGRSERIGLILGNLSFPSRALAQYAEHVWLSQQGAGFLRGAAAELAGLARPHPLNRFMSGQPALLAARALGLEAGAFALDAACASALYAIKIACDWLHDRKADVMVAGAVNAADSMFLHMGFCALAAISKSGHSRPFDRDADGLVPAEGAGFVCLKRLEDAIVAGDRILGVIRGVGLANDGRARGLLVPSEEGQVRAMQLAYAMSGLAPRELGFVECHATGTALGDATELRSMATVFADAKQLPIGSIKANLGHLITTAGMAGVFKILAGMAEGVLPPMPAVERPIDELGRARFRLLTECEPWPGERPRRAAVNAFGFGGNNAHLLLEQWRGQRPQNGKTEVFVAGGAPPALPVAVVGVSALLGDDPDFSEFCAQLFARTPASGSRQRVSLGLEGLRFPPSDLQQTLAQQLFILELARELARGLKLPRERTAVLIGIGTDPEVARYGARWQLGLWAERWGAALGGELGQDWLGAARDAAQVPLSAAGVLGTMPNIPANRINSQLDLAGPSMTVSAEELSGLAALELALRALRAGEIDAALVGAVDFSDEAVQRAALAELGRARLCADGAAVLVLKRLDDARRDGERIWAVFDRAEPSLRLGDADGALDLVSSRGSAHAASGLLQVASGIAALHHGARPGPERAPLPWFGARAVEITLGAPSASAAGTPPSAGDSGGAERSLGADGTARGRGTVRAQGAPTPAGPSDSADGTARSVVAAEGAPAPAGSGSADSSARSAEGSPVEGAVRASAEAWGGAEAAARVRVVVRAEGPPAPLRLSGPLSFKVYAGADRAAVRAALAGVGSASEGPARLVIAAFSPEEASARAAEAQRFLEHGGALPEGVAYRDRPLAGELAFVFTGAAAAYPGMGSELLLALPQIAQPFLEKLAAQPSAAEALQRGFATPAHALDQLWACSLLCQSHAELSQRVFGIRPDAAIGYSSGESNALFALGAWRDPEAMYAAAAASPIFAREICGEFAALERAWKKRGARGPGAFRSFAVALPLAAVETAIAGEPCVHVTILNAPNECVIGGEPAACERVLARLGKERAWPIAYNLACHCPELEEIREAWFALHRRKTWEVPGVRFYWNGLGEARPPSELGAADAISRQAVQRLDFPRIIERAYADGVRVFVEHGPKGLCSGWIASILGEREHLAVPLDLGGRSSVRQAAYAAGALLAHGVRIDVPALEAALGGAVPARSAAPSVSVSAHRPELRLPAIAREIAFMAPAPAIAPVHELAEAAPASARAIEAGQRARGHARTEPATGPEPPPLTRDQPRAEAATAPARTPARAPEAAPMTRGRAQVAEPMRAATHDPQADARALSRMPASDSQSSARAGRAEAQSGAALAHAESGIRTASGESPEPAPAAIVRSPQLARGPRLRQSPALAQAAQQARLSAVHREFLQRQAEVQQRFLSLQQRMLSGLVDPVPRGVTVSARGAQPTARATLTAPPVRASIAPAVQRGSEGARARPAITLVELVPPAPSASEPRAAPPQAMGGAAAPEAAPRSAPRPAEHEGAAPAPPVTALAPAGRPKFSRAELLIHASGRISSIFGPVFEGQDRYTRQVRMPEPPLLLVDRVTDLRGAPGSMGTGAICTETDVRDDSWYLQDGRVPAGIMIEAGQADLMLISWLGVDRYNRGERVYRLLGCELTYHGELPRVGDVLAYEIHIDGHAQQGDTRLFFFHYDCHIGGRLALSVRRGQAGFFSDAELADSAGVLWDPVGAEHVSSGPLAAPRALCGKRSFDPHELRAFSEGRTFACFGAGFELAQTHVDSPRIASGQLLLLERVTELDPRGGPWQRGYLRAELSIQPDDWFFAGHFKNDPCMPGTLMFEGCLQAMAFYLTALGFTLERDGYRFEPVPEQSSVMRCRGQVSPSSKCLVYELFVQELSDGPVPTLQADLLCTVDGLKAFHARRFGLRLAPDWPLDRWKLRDLSPPMRGGEPLAQARLGGLRGYVEPKPVASHDGFRFDYASLLACAWGRPTTAFGPFYRPFDGARRVARLPGPPYHFVSRVLRIEAELGRLRSGSAVEVEYDIPAEVWYFDDNGSPTMPLCVLMEAALQPCGWLASYIGSTLASGTGTDLMFRNLDGTATVSAEIRPGAEPLRTRARILSSSRSGEMIIQSFEVVSSLGDQPIYRMNTVFGFFPKEAFENQSGLSVSPEERARIAAPPNAVIDLRPRPARYFGAAPRIGSGMLCMLDRVTAYDPRGGAKGLGYARAEKDVDPGEWFFKAHFFQDPVQPGSLGIEAFCQLLQFVMIEQGMMEGVEHPRFEPIALDRPLSWKYRGQVVPSNRCIQSELELVEVGRDERGPYAVADAFLWVDGKRIYQAKGLGMRIVAGGPDERSPDRGADIAASAPAAGAGLTNGAASARASLAAPSPALVSEEEVLDPARDLWLLDHCPTWTLPALPMMSMVDRLAGAALRQRRGVVSEISDVQVRRWLPFAGGPVRLRTELSEAGDEELAVTLSAFRHAKSAALSRFEPVATGRVCVRDAFEVGPSPLPALAGGEPIEDPYASGTLFHGPRFQLLRSLRLDASGASAELDVGADGVPPGTLRQGLLDALTHAIPHDQLRRWSAEIPLDHVAYPYRIAWLRLYGELPAGGPARVEARFAGFDGDPRLPAVDIQLIADGQVRVALRLVEILLPKGPIGMAPPAARRAFLRDRQYVPGLGLSQKVGDESVLELATLQQSDWLPGNVARIYAVREAGQLLEQVAAKDHVAREAELHPAQVELAPDGKSAFTRQRPLRRYPLQLSQRDGALRVRGDGPSELALSPLRAFWREHFAIGPWPVEDLYCALVEQFVGDLVLTDPEGFSRVHGRSLLYLANHQVGIESLMFSVLIPALSGLITLTLAKGQHRDSWLGRLIEQSFSYPGVRDPGMITFFDREDPAALPRIAQQIAAELAGNRKSAMIHVEGTRALSCRSPVSKLSSAVLDMALSGSTGKPLSARLEFPLGYGRQEIWIGSPIAPGELRNRSLKERIAFATDAINGTGPAHGREQPSAPNHALAERVCSWVARTGCSSEDAVLIAALQASAPASPLSQRLLDELESARFQFADAPEERWLASFARRLQGAAAQS